MKFERKNCVGRRNKKIENHVARNEYLMFNLTMIIFFI